MYINQSRNRLCIAAVLLIAGPVFGQFEINWHTVDGGGGMNSVGGTFSLSGTIGQSDAQVSPVMSGGPFELAGGFWVASTVCNCPGDINLDGLRNGSDIQNFTQCLTSGGTCICANVDGLGGVNFADVTAFVAALLAGAACP